LSGTAKVEHPKFFKAMEIASANRERRQLYLNFRPRTIHAQVLTVTFAVKPRGVAVIRFDLNLEQLCRASRPCQGVNRVRQK
jgi:hypothetical protein